MFLKSCWRADKESAFNRYLASGLSDLLALNDESVFQCLSTAGLALIIMQTAADLDDVKPADGGKE